MFVHNRYIFILIVYAHTIIFYNIYFIYIIYFLVYLFIFGYRETS